MNKLFRNDLTTLLWRLLPLYAVLMICRIVFYYYNASLLGGIGADEVWMLLKGSLVFDTISVLYLNSLFIALSIVPLRVRGHRLYQRALFWIYMITNSAGIVVLNLADSVYFHFARKRLTAEEMHFAGNDNNSAIILRSMADNWYLVPIAAGLIAALWFAYKKIKYRPTDIRNPWAYYPVNLAVACFCAAMFIGGVRGGFSHGIRPYTLSNAAHYAKSPQKASMVLSNPFCVLRTSGISEIEVPHYFDDETLGALFTPRHNNYHDRGLDKKNVVLFIMESFSKEHSGYLNPDIYPDGQGFTPFLDSLMQEGFTFPNAFANGTKSIDALPSIFTSIPSYKTPFALLPNSLGEMRGLPRLLADEGYQTSFFSGAQKNSMGFEAYGRLAGIEKFYSREDFEKAKGSGKELIEPYWGVFDMPFYGYMGEVLSRERQPFFASVFNLTSHHPFVVPPGYEGKLPQGHTKIHKCVAYTDLSIRKLFDQIKSEPWFGNTIFVFVADHVSSEVYAEKTRTPKGNSAIMMFIYTPDGSVRGSDASTTQQLDVMPTLLGLLGYNKPYFAFGRDVFGEPWRMPMATNYYNQLYQCITDPVTIYFDGSKTIDAFSSDDILQKNNIADPSDQRQAEAEQTLKGLLQSYYTHVKNKDYLAR